MPTRSLDTCTWYVRLLASSVVQNGARDSVSRSTSAGGSGQATVLYGLSLPTSFLSMD